MKTFLVGGAVRDKLMHIEPKDRDWVIVGATTQDVQSLLDQGFTQVGADFPVFLHPQTNEEYALARVERKTGVGYGGFTVQADESVTIEDDLIRRDLTINSMALDGDQLIDPYGGLADLHNHVLRHTSSAFAEDPLRVLRLARFAGRYEFSIAQETIELCKQIAASNELNALSKERIWAELDKGLQTKSPDRFIEVLHQTGAITKCEILHDVFGLTETDEFDNQAKLLRALKSVKLEDRLTIAVAVCAKSTIENAAARVVACAKNVQDFKKLITLTSVNVSSFMRNCGALRNGTSFNDVVSAAMVLEMAGQDQKLSPRQLELAQRAMLNVRASDEEFVDLTGKELGTALDKARSREMKCALNLNIG